MGSRILINAGLVLTVVAALSLPAWADTWYVDVGNAVGPWDGASWATAFQTIQESVDAASGAGGGEVWVAEGTYTGMGSIVVGLAEGVHLYGGFAGAESDREERDWRAYGTIIDGEDARRCVYASHVDDATLDGFTVARGNEGDGGGMYNQSSPILLANCTFSNNAATEHGGALYNTSSALRLNNCVFSGNSGKYGGGIYNNSESTFLENCTFSENSAKSSGGAMYNRYASPSITN
jgi:predicted outer membrane repeat protein